jgi:hypothetical protein
MESDHVKPTPPDDTQLESWLRTNSSLPSLPDDGFSRRVLAALPASSPSRLTPRLLAIAIGAASGIAFAAFKFSTAAPVDFSLPPLGLEMTEALAHLTDPKLHAALGTTAVTLMFVFWRDLRKRVGL